MEKIEQPKGTFLLEKSLYDFHQEAMKWYSEVDLWKIELNLFQKLLDKHAPDLETVDQKKHIDHFQNLIIYYNGELLDEFRHEVGLHEKHLARALHKDKDISDLSLRNEHANLHRRLDAFSSEFTNYKKELFEFLEKLI